jgi:hypothetical protein
MADRPPHSLVLTAAEAEEAARALNLADSTLRDILPGARHSPSKLVLAAKLRAYAKHVREADHG